MDATRLLESDHKSLERLFRRFEKTGKGTHVAKREVVDRIIEGLSAHAAIEEQFFYPVVRATVPGTEDMALESLEEHHVVKWVLSELEPMAADDERFAAKVTVLIESVRHHVDEEEQVLFPAVRDELGGKALKTLGDAMASAKGKAPTHPHPRSPDTPPGNMIVGAAAGITDRIGDTVSGLAQGGVSAVADLIATVLHRKQPKVSPTGTKEARRTARQVRASAARATKTAIDGTRKARGVGQEAVRDARSGTPATRRASAKTATRVRTAPKAAPAVTKRAARKTAASVTKSRSARTRS